MHTRQVLCRGAQLNLFGSLASCVKMSMCGIVELDYVSLYVDVRKEAAKKSRALTIDVKG